MGKRFGSTIRIIAALFLSVFATNIMPVASAYATTGNNGTLKVHEYGTPSGTESNDPKVCTFNFEGFSFDPQQSGYIRIEGQGQTQTDYGNYAFGPTNASGYAETQYFNDQDGPAIAGGQYKATLYGKKANGSIDYNNEKAKSKVFKVDCTTEATPVAPTKVDPCGSANDGYIITATTGVKYYKSVWGTDPELSAGFHAEDDTVYIYAEAQSGYTLAGDDDWTFSYTDADCVATPTAPTKSDICGTQNDTYTIPTTEGVYYKVNGNTKNAGTYTGSGTVTIKAYAKSGYVLSGTKEWTFTFSTAPCVTTVTPTTPTSNEACGVQNDTYTIPAKTGVVYKVNGTTTGAGTYNGTSTVTIKAYAADATYVLSGDTEWTFNFDDAPCTIQVTPTAPTSVDVCGNFNDTYTIPTKTGVTYKVNGVPTSAGTHNIWMTPNVTSYTITAESAGSPYVINGTATWTFDFTNTACNSATIGQPEGCVDRGSHDGLFTVTVTNSSETESTYVVLVGGALADSATITAHNTYTFVLDGYNPGTYSVAVLKATYTGILPVGMPLPPFVFAGPSDWQYKDVLSGDVIIEKCPCEHEEEPVDVCPDMQGNQTDPNDCAAVDPGNGGGNPTTPTDPGQVLGDATNGGHILSTSTNVPNELPNTGASATNPWLTIVAAAIAFLAVRAITRKKLINDQL